MANFLTSPVAGPLRLLHRLPGVRDLRPAPPLVTPQVISPPFRGGPLKGPWQFHGTSALPVMPPTPPPNPPLPPPPSPPPPQHAGPVKPFLARDPRQRFAKGKDGTTDARLARFTETLSAMINSLMGKGRIFQTGISDWDIDTTAPTGTGPTGTFNSGAF